MGTTAQFPGFISIAIVLILLIFCLVMVVVAWFIFKSWLAKAEKYSVLTDLVPAGILILVAFIVFGLIVLSVIQMATFAMNPTTATAPEIWTIWQELAVRGLRALFNMPAIPTATPTPTPTPHS